MHNITNILEEKGSRLVHTVTQEATVLEAVEAMCAAGVGALLVCDRGAPLGIFSERDLMTRVILERRDPSATQVGEVMNTEVACVSLETSTDEAMAIMTERRCRHLPVVHKGAVVGLVSIGDLVRHETTNQQYEIRMLTEFICGKYPG